MRRAVLVHASWPIAVASALGCPADPDTPAVLVASDDGRPTHERMGYLAIERWTAWLRPAHP